jgi:glycerol kinase
MHTHSKPPCVLAIDEGTTGVRALVVNADSEVTGSAYEEISASYPKPGWVEFDAEAIWDATMRVCRLALREAGISPKDLRAIGVANQRATTVVWEKKTGRPIHAAIAWQDTRTAERIAAVLDKGVFTNSMASATKVEWLLKNVPGAVQRAAAGELCFGTIDTWLIWKLTGGAVHVTDYSNASCTTLYDAMQDAWDANALGVLGIPASMLPQIRSTSEVYGDTDTEVFGARVPIGGCAGDQQAAMFGELGTEKGAVKITFGTSAMVDVNVGDFPVMSMRGAYPLILWGLGGKHTYCLEGTVITAGACVQWLRDGLGIIERLEDSDALASSVEDSGGVWAMPSLQGLGTPYMQPEVRAVLGGISRGTTRAHIVRAVLEGIGYRTREALETLLEDASVARPQRLRVDGGAAANDFLLQQLADIVGIPVERPKSVQASALGAAYLAGWAVGVWDSLDTLRAAWRSGGVFEPKLGRDQADERFERWRETIESVRG